MTTTERDHPAVHDPDDLEPGALPPGVRVRWVDLRVDDLEVARRRELLSSAERAHADLGDPRVRAQRVLVRAAARELLGAAMGLPPRAVPLTVTAAGRPQVAAPGWDVGWSHADDVAVVAVAAGGLVGVDVEPVSSHDDAGSAEAWVRREAAWKRDGRGLGVLRQDPDPELPGRLLTAPPGHVAALATSAAAIADHRAPARTTLLQDFRPWFPGAPVDPEELHRASVERLDEFWAALLAWSGLPTSGDPVPVRAGEDIETARWFPGVRLNYAEALLAPRPGVDDDAPALTGVHADVSAETLTRRELRTAVADRAARLLAVGVGPGDRVALLGANSPQTAVTGLAVAAVGAALATSPPDMGPAALVARFGQVEPTVLLVVRGRAAEAGPQLDAVLADVPGIVHVVVVDDLPLPDGHPEVVRLADVAPRPQDVRPDGDWPRFPFDHPLFVMFSSGTTGPPKAMVHGIGGTLLEQVKEHRLHGDLHPGDTMYFHTTTAWMMWNWQLTALASGVHVVVYDGPVTDASLLWEFAARFRVTHFGSSPAHLQLSQDSGLRPGTTQDLGALRAVLSTGAVLNDWQFDWVSEAVGPQPLLSVSGGTDLLGCLFLGHPELTVRRGRLQTRSLGIDVAAVDEDGREVVGAPGALVVRRPFPSRPVRFLQDPDGQRFHDAYFAERPGLWTHGDLVEIGADGSARVLGRVDGVLNIDGVRIGPGEITTALRGIPQVADTMAVEQPDPARPGSGRMVLLVVLTEGSSMDDQLERAIRRTLRQQASPAHVPSVVLAVPGLPTTHNGKRSDAAARAALAGEQPRNLTALRNPETVTAIAAAAAAADVLPGAAPGAVAELPAGGPAVAPDPALRDQVAALWCDVLGVSEARDDDHYADRGGASRQLVGLLRRIKLDLGREVAMDAVLADPTFAGLLRATAAAGRADTSGVTLLRRGVGRPLYMTVDAWGQLNSVSRLAEALDTDRPVLGLRTTLTRPDGSRATIEEMGAETVALLREHQPEGPYSLLGYSFGGLVAFDTAQRLLAAGQEVAFLGLVDAFPTRANLTARQFRARRLAGVVKAYGGPGHVLRWVRQRLQPTAMSPEDRAWHEGAEVYDAYRVEPYAGPVTYFLATDDLPLVADNATIWRAAAARIVVVEVPGDHMALLAHEQVGALADRVSALLR